MTKQRTGKSRSPLKSLTQISKIHDLNLEKIKIATIENTKIGMPLFAAILVILQALYLYDFIVAGLFSYYGYTIGSITILQWAVFTAFLSVMAISLGAITIGVLCKHLWARRFSILYVSWLLMWPIWGLILGLQLLQNAALLMIELLLLGYLFLRAVKNHFLISTDICIYGNCVLYTKDIVLKNGRRMPIYFFSTRLPKSGTPSPLPQGYVVEVNSNSGMPYLRKMHPDAYRHGSYVLYTKDVTLRNGREMPIFFFSSHKPKSGKPVAKPHGYVIKENPISHMPYLKRDHRVKAASSK